MTAVTAVVDPALVAPFSVLTSWDWALGLTGAVSGLFGFWRGFVRTLAHVLAWLMAAFGAPLLHHAVQPWLPAASSSLAAAMNVPPWVLPVVQFLFVFIAVRLAGRLLLKGVRAVGLGGVDRLLGFVAGIARAVVIIGLAAVVAQALGFAASPAWRQAQCRPLLDFSVRLAQPLVSSLHRPATTGI